ncbi:MAG: hypothetical protein K5681_01560 [Treponema sp.]|nr:hypothetical protein [Treponema sp.]
MTQTLKRGILTFLQGSLIASLVIASVAVPFSCSLNEEGIQIVGGDFSSPVLEKFTVIDNQTLQFDFSEAVSVKGIVISPWIPGLSDSDRASYDENLAPSLAAACGTYGQLDAQVISSEDPKSFNVIISQQTQVGKSYEVYGMVEDEIGNSLTFCLPFIGYNSCLPRLILSEVQIKYGKGSVSGQTVYRGEYVELLALEDGNLAGLVLQGAADGTAKDYTFPAIEVSKGEIILLHLRTVGEGCVNETGEDLNLATAPHSAEGIRDLWSENTTARFNDSSDVIVLYDSVNKTIMDALMYASPDAIEWKSNVSEKALEVAQAGIYDSAEISMATSSKGATTLKALTRSDAADIRNLIMEDQSGDYDFPIHADESSWAIAPCSPGQL